MTNHLPRIEREAKTTYANLSNPRDRTMFISGYITGGRAELNRAAPVVKALEDRLAEWQVTYNTAYAAAERMRVLNETANPKVRVEYPEIPAWVKEVKQILETYKNDNV